MAGGAASKHKGSTFERQLCRTLSLWVSAGTDDDWFWRSAMSGGRATLRVAKHGAQRVAGDICATAPGGHALTDYYYIEAKHLQDIELTSFIVKGKGNLTAIWRSTIKQAEQHGRLPMLVAKQNLMPAIVLLPFLPATYVEVAAAVPGRRAYIYILDRLVEQPYSIPRLRLLQKRLDL